MLNNELGVVSKVFIKFQQLKKEILRDQATNVRKQSVICLKTNIQLFESNRVVTKQYRLKHGVESKIKYVLWYGFVWTTSNLFLIAREGYMALFVTLLQGVNFFILYPPYFPLDKGL